MYDYRGIVTNVVDGDTVDIDVQLGFGVIYDIRVRLNGIDTPEIFRPKTANEKMRGYAAKRFVEKRILGKNVNIITFKDKKGKYGRYIADIVYEDGEKGACFISEELKLAGYVKSIKNVL